MSATLTNAIEAQAPPECKTPQDEIVVSYLNLRGAIGFVGLGLPFALLLGEAIIQTYFPTALGPQRSMSEYYYTAMRGVFVGSLCAIGAFLGSYRGEHHPWDRVLALVACVSAIGVALFPCGNSEWAFEAMWEKVLTVLHFSFAGILFFILATFCVWLFPKYAHGGPQTKAALPNTSRKPERNFVYHTCGIVIYSMIAAIGIWKLLTSSNFYPQWNAGLVFPWYPIYWFEFVAVATFGFSWIVKGHFILPDKDENSKK